MEEYKRLSTAGKSFGIESEILSPKEAQKLFPLLDQNSFTGALYSPGDGMIDPAMFVGALTKSAKSHGARVILKDFQIHFSIHSLDQKVNFFVIKL